MGQRGRTETLAQVVVELMRERTLSQAELAKRVGVNSRVVRQCVLDLSSAGMPIERQEDHPHVFYSVRRDWVPNGLVLSLAEARELLRMLARVPTEASRRAALVKQLGIEPGIVPASVALEDSLEDRELEILQELEDATTSRNALRVTYYSVARGVDEERHISCQRIAYQERPLRMLVRCHRDGALKWFLLSRVRAARADDAVPYEEAEPHEIDEFVRNTVFDYHQRGEATEHRFVVHAPQHRWFVPLLGAAVVTEPVGESVRVTLRSASTMMLARQLVGLGAAARVESEALRAEVRRLATEALAALDG